VLFISPTGENGEKMAETKLKDVQVEDVDWFKPNWQTDAEAEKKALLDKISKETDKKA
jgi:hypothetical protein